MNNASRTAVKKSALSAKETIAARKANLAAMIVKLQARIAAVPDDGNWANAGDLGWFEETLGDIVNPEE